ncbi:MAG: cyclic pyranopterin monophosphate synthase MoaC [Desulfurococcales archaeon]|nr:cyclic pyranopterin monophosphate synthase MoaC [Desulfurococcales archaeon]
MGREPVRMVDISPKPPLVREAVAEGTIRLRPETVERIRQGRIEKGDVLSVATVAAVLAVKNTPNIIPLCHPIPIHNVKVDYELGRETVTVRVKVKTKAETGVEMEALTGVSAALLTIWDMVKKYEKDEEGQYPETRISNIRVLSKVKRADEE